MTSTIQRPRSTARSQPRRATVPPSTLPRPRARRRRVRVGSRPRRIGLLTLAILVGVAFVVARLVQIQVLQQDRYVDFGDRQGSTDIDIVPARGAILDRDFSVLALSDVRPTVYADPQYVDDPVATAAQLATVLDIDEGLIAERLSDPNRRFVYIARQISLEDRDLVAQLGLEGIKFLDEPSRLRPNGDDLARGVLGSVDIDQNPLSGVEAQFGAVLAGSGGHLESRIARNGLALPTSTRVLTEAQAGNDLVLTLHTETQWLTEQVLLDAVESSGAKGGMVVVMEVGTGEILALAGASRDPESGEVRVSRHTPAYSQVFEPGSVSKTFTIAAALEEGTVRADDLFSIPPDYEFADKVFEEPYVDFPQALTVTEILARSSNIGTIQVAESIGRDTLYWYLRRFGFGEMTGAGGTATVPTESAGILHPAAEWHGTGLATISFGQGIAVTAVQLAGAYNTIANNGIFLSPTLYRGTIDGEGQMHPAPPGDRRRVLSANTSAQVRAMLADVVTDGTGIRAAVDGFSAAGKTGTAQKALVDRPGYSETAYMATFAGFVPAQQPELTIVVTIDEPTEEHLAGLVAAPVFSDVAEYALRVMRVAPTE